MVYEDGRMKVLRILVFAFSVFAVLFAGCSSNASNGEIDRLKMRNAELFAKLTLLQFDLDECEEKIEGYKEVIDTAEANRPKTNILLSDNKDYLSALVLPAEKSFPFGAVEMTGYIKTITEEGAEGGDSYQRTVFVIVDTDPLLLELYRELLEKGNTINSLVDGKVAVYFAPPDEPADLELLHFSDENQFVRIYTYLYRFDRSGTYSRVPDRMKIVTVQRL